MLQNLAGQVLLSEEYYTPGNYELNHSLKSGIYIVSFTSGTAKQLRKKYLLRVGEPVQSLGCSVRSFNIYSD